MAKMVATKATSVETATGEMSPTETTPAVESATAEASPVEPTTMETATATTVAAPATASGNGRSCGNQSNRDDASRLSNLNFFIP